MRAALVLGLFLLSGCAFSAPAPLFTGADAAYPFADGTRVEMTTSADERQLLTFTRAADGGYVLTGQNRDGESESMPLLFVDVPETPEEDYIVQVHIDTDDNVVAFGFAWRMDGGALRIFSDPDAFDETAHVAQLDALCTRLTFGECQLDTREEVLAVARDLVAPHIIRSDATLDDWIDLTPQN
ncbi:MAG: hypothetical protein AB7J28_11685 [Hyphomonadaceae bacterium]